MSEDEMEALRAEIEDDLHALAAATRDVTAKIGRLHAAEADAGLPATVFRFPSRPGGGDD